MANELSMADQESIGALLRQGWSKRRIARELKLHRDTVRRYARELGLEGNQRGPGQVAGRAGDEARAEPKQATQSEVTAGATAPQTASTEARSLSEKTD